jgi:hypothetical protein
VNSELGVNQADDTTFLRIAGSNGNVLQFRFLRHSAEEVAFIVTLHSAWLNAETQMTTYVYGPPTKFFDDMAASWRGWEGEKTWGEIESRVELRATIDKLGHITMTVHLRQDAGLTGRATEVVMLDAGGLERLASLVHRFFDAYPVSLTI